jgi:hypothetical protein
MPFGGVKASGHGRFGTSQLILMSIHTDQSGGEEGLRSLCTPKSIIHDRLFSLIRTPIPKVVGESSSALCRYTWSGLTNRFPTSRPICLLGLLAWASVDCLWWNHTEGNRSGRIDQSFFSIDTYNDGDYFTWRQWLIQLGILVRHDCWVVRVWSVPTRRKYD